MSIKYLQDRWITEIFPIFESKPLERKLNYDKVQYSNSNIIASVI